MTVNPRRPVTLRAATSLGNVQPAHGTGGSGKDPGKTAAAMTADMDALRDSQPMVTRCAHCSATFVGLAGDGRTWFRAHLADRHPEVKVPRRRRTGTGLGAWSKRDSVERAEAMVEVEARKAMLG